MNSLTSLLSLIAMIMMRVLVAPHQALPAVMVQNDEGRFVCFSWLLPTN